MKIYWDKIGTLKNERLIPASLNQFLISYSQIIVGFTILILIFVLILLLWPGGGFEINVVIEALIHAISFYRAFFKSLVLEAALLNESD